MRYVQFYTQGNIISKKPPYNIIGKQPVWSLGSDGVFPLDGRWSLETCKSVAWELARKRKMLGFEIIRAESYNSRNQYKLTKLILLEE